MKLIKQDSTLFFLLLPIKKRIILARHQALWRKRNTHNKTVAKNLFPIEKVKVGEGTYGEIEYYNFGNESATLIIGSYCSIAGDVKFLGGGNHPIHHISTYPFSRFIFGRPINEDTKGPIFVEDDVWICDGCTILSGVRIGQGAIIAANSIVTKNVPPYAIWMGNTVLKYRFEDNTRAKLRNLIYSKIKMDIFSELCDLEITDCNIDEILNKLQIE